MIDYKLWSTTNCNPPHMPALNNNLPNSSQQPTHPVIYPTHLTLTSPTQTQTQTQPEI